MLRVCLLYRGLCGAASSQHCHAHDQKLTAPFCFLTGRSRASGAGPITSLQQWCLEETWQSVVHDAHSLLAPRCESFTRDRKCTIHRSCFRTNTYSTCVPSSRPYERASAVSHAVASIVEHVCPHLVVKRFRENTDSVKHTVSISDGTLCLAPYFLFFLMLVESSDASKLRGSSGSIGSVFCPSVTPTQCRPLVSFTRPTPQAHDSHSDIRPSCSPRWQASRMFFPFLFCHDSQHRRFAQFVFAPMLGVT